MIDAYSHFQFLAENRQAFVAALKMAVAAAFSPLGAFVSIPLSVAFLLLDARVRRRSFPTTMPAPLQPPEMLVAPAALSNEPKEKFPISCGVDFRYLSKTDSGAIGLAPGEEPSGTVGYLIGFTNEDSVTHSVSARIYFSRKNRKNEMSYRTLFFPVWTANQGNVAVLPPHDRDFLVLAVENCVDPGKWFTLEDHRLTSHRELGIESLALEPLDTSMVVALTVDGTREKTFNFGANFKTFSLVPKLKRTDLTPKPKTV